MTDISKNEALAPAGGYGAARNLHLIMIRVITAVTLFAVLGEANVWLDTTTNTVLALGYRFGLVLLPLTLNALGARSLVTSLAFMAAGAALLSLQGGIAQSVAAACLFSYGAAVSGYLIKNVAAQTKRGAANNRVAMNVGSLVAGIIIMLPILTPHLFFWGAAALVAFCALIALPRSVDVSIIHVKIFEGQSASTFVAWVLVGAAMGMMLFGVFSVLPQTILKSGMALPGWYGFMIILNSAVVVLGQMPTLKLIEKMGRFRMATIFAFVFVGFALLAFPDLFHVHTLVGASIWVLLVSVAECAFGHIDYYSVKQKAMFIKEICIGLGAALTVGLMRSIPLPYSSMLVAGMGIVFTLTWWLLTRRQLRAFD
ncbi:hypothetical protein [Rhizobium sp. BK602]|uniref:hypothetical protein n=1 Tax=Rhizobium sp. BK602 TaxID=2586986 RepID=UPI0016156E20|nr:hypothetical protein [Rhizobium sp. BK602]MBB3610456.1 hypothetical protein [Rhizobium sp. BK602]